MEGNPAITEVVAPLKEALVASITPTQLVAILAV